MSAFDLKFSSEIKLASEGAEQRVEGLKPTVFVSVAQRDPSYDTPMTGDIDYAHAIVEQSNRVQPGSTVLIKELYQEQEIYKYILSQPSPILHVMLNPPFTGMAFTPKGIQGFKERGGKVIITAIEFAKFEGREEEYKEKFKVYPQQIILEFLAQADGAIFLDENDKNAALRFFKGAGVNNAHVKTILESARIIPVLPTILPMTRPLAEGGFSEGEVIRQQQLVLEQAQYEKKDFKEGKEQVEQQVSVMASKPIERGKDIISFGIIRPGKGLGLVIELARNIKQQNINKKVLVVGTVLNNVEGLRELRRLMLAVYPGKHNEIMKIASSSPTTLATSAVPALKKKLREYQGASVSALPLEIYTDVEKSDLPALFNRCSYAFLPAYRGATLRNSSISSCIAQEFIVYTHSEGITPSTLLEGGSYHGAIVIKDFEGDSNHDGGAGRRYVLSVLQDVLKRDKNPELNKPNLDAMRKLLNDVLSPQAIARQHLELYSSLGQPVLVASVQYAGKHWRAVTQAKRAYRHFREVHGIDIVAEAEKNFAALKKRLGELKKEEQEFCDSLLSGDWYLTHTTSDYPQIQKDGNALLSLKERVRRSMKINNRRTPHNEGNDDNVFFAFGPGEISSPDYLKDAKYVIKIDFKKGLREKLQKKTHGLTGVWFSSHVYAFLTEQDCLPVSIHGAKFSVRYRKNNPTGPVATQNIEKIYSFEYVDPSSGKLVQSEERIRLQDELFLVQNMQEALVLMSIERIRKLGPTAWSAIMKEESLACRQQIVQEMFHTGLFEAHKPGFLSLAEDYITVEERPQASESSPLASAQPSGSIQELSKAILEGNVDVAYKLIEENSHFLGMPCPIPSVSSGLPGTYDSVYCHLLNNPFNLAVVTKNTALVRRLLNSGNPILSKQGSLTCKPIKRKWIYDTLITAVLLLASPKIKEWTKYYKAEQDVKLYREYLSLLTREGFVVSGKPHLRQPYVIRSCDIQNAITFELPIQEIEFLITLESNIHPRHLPLRLAVATDNCELVSLMLKMGADANQGCNWDENMDEQLIGSLPLLQAILRKNEQMINLLLSQADIDVNQRWDKSGEFYEYTPLMLATEQGLSSVVSQLLLRGAKVGYINPTGKTALEIATAKGFDDIAKMLTEAMPPSAIQASSAWEKAALARPHHLRVGIILLAKDNQGQVKILIVEKQLVQEQIVTSFPFDPEEDSSMSDFYSEHSQLKVVNKGKLLEWGFQHSPSNTYYGVQLYFLEFSTESLQFFQKEVSDVVSVEALETLQTKKGRSHPFSSAEKVIFTHLQLHEKEDGGQFCIATAGQGQVEQALMAYLNVCIDLRQAIEKRNIEAIQTFLRKYPDACLDEFILPGEYPGYPASGAGYVDTIKLALLVGFTEGILAFFKSGTVRNLKWYGSYVFEAIIRQDDLETFLEAIGQPTQQGGLKLSVEAVEQSNHVAAESISSSMIAGWGKELFEISSCLAVWFSKQAVATDKIAKWILQNRKEKFKEVFDVSSGSSVLSKSISSLSVQNTEYWLERMKVDTTSSFFYLMNWLTNGLRRKNEPLNDGEQARFLQILAKLVRDENVIEAHYVQNIIVLLRDQWGFLEEVLQLSITCLKPEKRGTFIKGMLLMVPSILKALNSAQKNLFYNTLANLLVTIEYDSSGLSSICYELIKYVQKDRPALQSILEALVTNLALNPGSLDVNPIVKFFKEPCIRALYSEFFAVFDKIMDEKERLRERALRAREEAEDLVLKSKKFEAVLNSSSLAVAPSVLLGDPSVDRKQELEEAEVEEAQAVCAVEDVTRQGGKIAEGGEPQPFQLKAPEFRKAEEEVKAVSERKELLEEGQLPSVVQEASVHESPMRNEGMPEGAGGPPLLVSRAHNVLQALQEGQGVDEQQDNPTGGERASYLFTFSSAVPQRPADLSEGLGVPRRGFKSPAVRLGEKEVLEKF